MKSIASSLVGFLTALLLAQGGSGASSSTFLRGDFTWTTPPAPTCTSVVTSSSQATVDFSSISSSYSALKVYFQVQAVLAGTGMSSLAMKVNNDNDPDNYTATGRIGSQNGGMFASEEQVVQPGGVTQGTIVAIMPNAGNTNHTATGEILLLNYAGTTWNKRFLSTYGAITPNVAWGTQALYSSAWLSNSAINQLTFSIITSSFTDGSTFMLCGINPA